MSKNVLIVTMPASDNYGNRLQNYAIAQLLDELGFRSETLRVKGDVYEHSLTPEKPFFQKLTPAYIKRFLQRNQRKNVPPAQKQKRLACFDAFDREYVRFTPYSVTSDNMPLSELSKYDFAVCGSDQIWNPLYGMISLYFLDFLPDHKRVSLAPSLGVEQMDACYDTEYRSMLQGMAHLSAREESGAQILRDLTGRDAVALQDPTLWIGKDAWSRIAKRPEHAPASPYLLCYFLGKKTARYQKRIEQYAKACDLTVVNLAHEQDLTYYAMGPCEFVWLIQNAALVCTDSFHGAAFSLIFERPFVAFARTDGAGMGARMTGIMQHVGVDRWQQNVECAQLLCMPYDRIKEVLAQDRARAIGYILHAQEQAASAQGTPELAPTAYCNGCRACQVACPVGAIAWEQDAEGFYRPRLNADACIGCGKCQSVCHVHNRALDCTDEYPEAVAAWAKDTEIRTQSSSGGLFSVLAGEILQRSGVVFGAGFDDQWHVRHRFIERIEQLPLLRTSKYVQSDVGDCYARAKEFLEAGRWVYFSGTPCQIQGLRAYLGKDYDKLILQDIVCHGVPSERAWDAYLDQVHGGADAVGAVNFRDKKQGWKLYGMRIELGNALTYETERDQDAYMKAFLSNLDLRPSCYNCVNKTAKRNCDVTLADYWGIERVHPEIDAEPGVSLVLLQSEKGKRLLEDVSAQLQIVKTDAKQALQYNASAITSVKKIRGKRGAFFAGYQEDFATCVEKINRVSLYRRAYSMLGRIKYRVIKIFKK